MVDEEIDQPELGGVPDDSCGERIFERPLECSECQRSTSVRYTEIANGVIKRTTMCADCPFLENHLYGALHADASSGVLPGQKGLVCGDCGTSLAEVRTGALMGCSHCYEVFEGIIFNELVTVKRLPQRSPALKGAPLHKGRGPGEKVELSSSLKLIALNEALNETLTREDYEQAAWLRDQIKKLTENPDAPK